MKCLKNQRLEFFLWITIIAISLIETCNGNTKRRREQPLHRKSVFRRNTDEAVGKNILQQKHLQTMKITNGEVSSANITSKLLDNNTKTSNATAVTAKGESSTFGRLSELNSGALFRGFLVLLGLSAFVIVYIIFRSFRLNKSRAQMIRKYGVLTHRQDVEMRPLPLDEEEEEDTTLFDATLNSPNNVLHQNL
ncbi:membrane protein FAM174 [Prorops nasuta]|uniref:membrane protein FAM174 n=1 Tax=Prorops nasuta TaxID=863751 RepID=UPI0034CF965E